MRGMELTSIRYERTGAIARITLNRPKQGIAITADMPSGLSSCVEEAYTDTRVHSMLPSGEGPGFCGGYDLNAWAEHFLDAAGEDDGEPLSPVTVKAQARNHDPSAIWDPMMDWQAM